MKRKGVLLTLVVLLLLVNGTQATSSSNYAIDWMIPLTSGGGGTATSTNYVIDYSIGQSVIGDSESASAHIKLGFWQDFGQSFIEYLYQWLPIVRK